MIKNSFQILFSNKFDNLPPLILTATNSFKQALENSSYKLYNQEMVEEFLKLEYEKDVINAFNKLKPKAFKKDLASYCIAYKYGGWYSDITIKFIKNINENQQIIDFLGFVDMGNSLRPYTLPYPIVSSLFYANKGCQVLKKAIELIVSNCKIDYYGVSPTSPTGPGLLGRALAYYGLNRNQVIGHFMPLTPNHQNQNRSYILPDGSILALHKDAWLNNAKPAQILEFGITDSDNYLEMYNQKDIYNKNIL
tara:strand:- start:154 stop:906 length:753 start_codon:yes stop_codon:yes gene_type:complete